MKRVFVCAERPSPGIEKGLHAFRNCREPWRIGMRSMGTVDEAGRQRMLRARRLLENSDAPRDAVAAASGWESAARLCKVFKVDTGVTPTEYRRRARSVE